ncbi:xanthine dehydrogenase family protein molybdopterin-binding subunit [Microbaculum marinum]|uniref:Molybdopterin cofactor-binding domain-containing protein n=1 Tax=Microbaculum marinum TaxID=1764581 RepID=A0AAW9S1F1_9HYPH
MKTTRREFLATTVAGLAISVSPIHLLRPVAGSNEAKAATVAPPPDWQAGPGKARFRIDGLRKVTGRKTYARDFHARDLEGWPDEQDVVLVMRTPVANRTFHGLDLGRLPQALQPKSTITAEDLARDHIGIAEDDYPEGDYLLPAGKVPDYLGQEVALLYYDDFFTMDKARRAIRSDVLQGLSFGEEMPIRPETYYQPETSIIHAEPENGDEQTFSQVGGGPVRPEEARTPRDIEAMGWVDRIREMIASSEERGWTTLHRTYETQVIDPMFMEPESGLAWLDRETATLHMLIGTQSPSYDVTAAAEIFAGPLCRIGVRKVNFLAAYPGGGFGGRDTSILCLFLALAAAYSDRPVQIINDRFEQFQAGMKRHASRCDLSMAVDKDRKFRALRNYIYLNGGGRRNVSTFVAQVSGINGTGPYGVPYVDIWSRALKTRAITAGSIRAFGAVQSQFAIETMVDELAAEIGVDPIALRRANVLLEGEAVDTGAPNAPPGLPEMCDRAAAHRLWRERDARHAAAAGSDVAYGVGFAITMKNYGTGADAALDEVAIDPDGRITVTTNVIDMGNGSATTLAIATATHLGANATEVKTGYLDPFEALQLEQSFEMQPDNPRWTPLIHESTKASSTSSKWVHGVEQACSVLLASGLLPAARELWGAGAEGVSVADIRWEDGALAADGRQAIPLPALARQAHEKGHVVSAMIHAFYSGRWIEADYTIGAETHRWQIDALSVRRGGQTGRDLIDRKNAKLFTVESTYEGNGQSFGACACLASVTVNRRTGEVRLDEAVHYLGPGKVRQQDLLEGQLDGCFAMGLGQALLEDIPAYEDGGGDGLWNLHRYNVPLARDVGLGRVEKVILPPESDDAPARGIAEVGMIPIPPAIANAVAHATGVRFRQLPITPERVRAAWRG